MPSQAKLQNNQDSNNSLAQLSEALAFEQPEKLEDFVRRAVKWLLEEAPSVFRKSKKAASEDGLTFQLHPASKMLSEFELDFYSDEDKQNGTPMATIKCRGGKYRGLPDEHPPVARLEDLPPLVARRFIYAQAVRKGSRSEWTKINHNGNGGLVLDFEVKGEK